MTTPAFTADTLPSVDLLRDVAAELSRAARLADDRRNLNALNKAAYHLERGTALCWSAGDLLVPSANTVGQIYRVSRDGCSCEAGLNGHPCWHSSLAEIILVAWDRLNETDDAPAAVEDHPALTRLHTALAATEAALYPGTRVVELDYSEIDQLF